MEIYLAGSMTGTNFSDQIWWRTEFANQLKDKIYTWGLDVKYHIFNPLFYYNLEYKSEKSDREVFEFDIHKLKKCDLIVANLNKQHSIGTCMEVAIARDNGIPVIGLYENKEELHPWLAECCIRVCDSMEELVDYVFHYYMW